MNFIRPFWAKGAALPWVLASLGLYWLALIHQLGAQWTVYTQYNYGWSVPFLCAYLLWHKFQPPYAPNQPVSSGSRGPTLPKLPTSAPFRFPNSTIFFLIIVCALLYAPTRFFHEANPIWRLTSLLWTIEVIGITLCVLRLVSRNFQTAIFPLCFFLVAVPWPSGLETFLVQTLTRLNVSCTVEALGWMGIPALQHGNVIEVAGGQVGVDEACSGIRSLQATLMIALFLGEYFRLSLARRVVLCFTGFALSFVFNLVRTSLLATVAAKKSSAAVPAWHDPAGVTILIGCFVALWLTALWMNRKPGSKNVNRSKAGNGSRPEPFFAEAKFGLLRPELRGACLALLAWFVLVEAGTRAWFRCHEKSPAAQQSWSVNLDATNLSLKQVAVSGRVRAQFRADESHEVRWRDESGNNWQLYYFRWFPAAGLAKRVAVQLSKSHGPEVCLPAAGMQMETDAGMVLIPVGDMMFAFRQYRFQAGGQQIHVFYAIYEDQTGTVVLASRRKDTASRIQAALAGSRNDGQCFLEIAVTGPDTVDAAKLALSAELVKLIRPL